LKEAFDFFSTHPLIIVVFTGAVSSSVSVSKIGYDACVESI
jgi:hypothetical protein